MKRALYLNLFLLLLSPTVEAIDVSGPRPTLNPYYRLLEDAFLTSEDEYREWRKNSFLFTTQINYMDEPLGWHDAREESHINLVDSSSSVSMGIGVLFNKYLLVSIDLGVHTQSFPNGKNQTEFGDLRLTAKQRVWEKDNFWGVTLSPEVFFPTGDEETYLSNDSVGYGLMTASEFNFDIFRLAFNFGYRYFPNAILHNLDYRSQFLTGLGLRFPLGSKLDLNFEGLFTLLTDQDDMRGPGEFQVSSSYRWTPKTSVFASMGVSRFADTQDSSFQTTVGFKYIPGVEPVQRLTQVISEQECKIENLRKIFVARSVSASELGMLLDTAPYDTEKFQVISPGENNMKTSDLVYVQDRQVVFAVDLSELPNKKDILPPLNLTLSGEGVRFIDQVEGYDTEFICLANEKLCSGETFENKSWTKYINHHMFGGRETPNDYFLRLWSSNSKRYGAENHFVLAKFHLDFKKMLENVPDLTLVDILYGFQDTKESKRPNNAEDGFQNRTLYFFVADDIYLKPELRFEVEYSQNICHEVRQVFNADME